LCKNPNFNEVSNKSSKRGLSLSKDDLVSVFQEDMKMVEIHYLRATYTIFRPIGGYSFFGFNKNHLSYDVPYLAVFDFLETFRTL